LVSWVALTPALPAPLAATITAAAAAAAAAEEEEVITTTITITSNAVGLQAKEGGKAGPAMGTGEKAGGPCPKRSPGGRANSTKWTES